jgi:hypothetical protein
MQTTVIVGRFYWYLKFSRQDFEIIKVPNFRKIRPVRAEISHADSRMDRRTDMTKLIVAFPNSSNAPKTAYYDVKQINTVYKQVQNFLLLIYTVNQCHFKDVWRIV